MKNGQEASGPGHERRSSRHGKEGRSRAGEVSHGETPQGDRRASGEGAVGRQDGGREGLK